MSIKIDVSWIDNHFVKYVSTLVPLRFTPDMIFIYDLNLIEERTMKEAIIYLGEDVSDFDVLQKALQSNRIYAIFPSNVDFNNPDVKELFYTISLPHALVVNPLFNTDATINEINDIIIPDSQKNNIFITNIVIACKTLDNTLCDFITRHVDIQPFIKPISTYIMDNLDGCELISPSFMKSINNISKKIEHAVESEFSLYDYLQDEERKMVESAIIDYYTILGRVYHKSRFMSDFNKLNSIEYGKIRCKKGCFVRTDEIMTTLVYPAGL